MLFDFVDWKGKATDIDFKVEDSETIACEENQDLKLEWEADWEEERIAEWIAALNADIEEYLCMQREIDADL